MYKLSVAPEEAPDEPEYLELEFEQGICVALGHERLGKLLSQLGYQASVVGSAEGRIRLSPFWTVKTLNFLGGRNGIGRVDLVENRFVGMKSRGVYETPGGSILFTAHRQVESLTMDREVMHLRDTLGPKYAELVYNGFWFAPERLVLQALITESQKNVTGVVRLKLYKGNIIVAGRKSPVSLYNPHIATMEADPTQAYNQSDATGFISLNGLRLKVEARVRGETPGSPRTP
jgi:argininosuccinate synthase